MIKYASQSNKQFLIRLGYHIRKITIANRVAYCQYQRSTEGAYPLFLCQNRDALFCWDRMVNHTCQINKSFINHIFTCQWLALSPEPWDSWTSAVWSCWGQTKQFVVKQLSEYKTKAQYWQSSEQNCCRKAWKIPSTSWINSDKKLLWKLNKTDTMDPISEIVGLSSALPWYELMVARKTI